MTADPRLLRKARSHLDLAAHHLEQAGAKLQEAGLVRKAGTLERLAKEATDQLGQLSTE